MLPIWGIEAYHVVVLIHMRLFHMLLSSWRISEGVTLPVPEYTDIGEWLGRTVYYRWLCKWCAGCPTNTAMGKHSAGWDCKWCLPYYTIECISVPRSHGRVIRSSCPASSSLAWDRTLAYIYNISRRRLTFPKSNKIVRNYSHITSLIFANLDITRPYPTTVIDCHFTHTASNLLRLITILFWSTIVQ